MVSMPHDGFFLVWLSVLPNDSIVVAGGTSSAARTRHESNVILNYETSYATN